MLPSCVLSFPHPILHQTSTDVPFVALDALQAAGDQGADGVICSL